MPFRLRLILVILAQISWSPRTQAQTALGLPNDRAHPELRWMERETEHFIVIYHQGLEGLAVRAATIAEQVYEPITQGLEIEMGGKTSIYLSEEDQIVNGFALPRRMFIWVHQNDYALYFGGTDKWLRQVIAHEFQHNVWMEAAQDWTGIWSLLRTPSWFVEGLAEYETEEWGAFRSDLDVRSFILRNRHRDLDPHDSGFSMVRYLAEQYGDSVLVRAVRRRGFLGLADFDGGFKEATGVGLKEFEEEWRRAATAHTYALYSQKEEVGDVGDHLESPAPRLRSLTWSPEGRFVAVHTRPKRGFPVLSVVRTDSTHRRYPIDHGILDSDVGFSPDGRSLVYAKMHRSHHGSILWDLKVADIESGRSRWITSGRRASHPHWSPVEDRIVFTAIDGSTTNLYTCDPRGETIEQLTRHQFDVQVLWPRFHPDGSQLAFVRCEPGHGLDLAVMDLATRETREVTVSPSHDTRPLWSRDGRRLFFTSDRNADEIPNVFMVPADGSEADVECVTDVGEALFAMDVHPDSGYVAALALATTDSVRLRRLDPQRRTSIRDPVIASRFVSWRDRVPPHPVPPIDYRRVPEMTEPRPYRAFRHMRTMAKFILPSPEPWGVTLAGLFVDTAHRNSILLGVDLGTDDDTFKLRGFYGRWDTDRLPFGVSGFLQVSGGIDSRAGLRIYAGDLLREQQNHLLVKWRFPMNAGEHFYAKHNLELFAELADVEVKDADDIDPLELAEEKLPEPLLDYQENKVGLQYRYTKSRPHRTRNAHALRGHGLLGRFEWADAGLGSDTEFRRLTLDASKVLGPRLFGLDFAAGSFFARVRGQAVWGDPAPQDFTGLRADAPILPVSYGSSYILDDVLKIGEAYALRGFARNVPGEQALATTLEWRLPLTGKLPVSAFGVSLGGVTGVLFYDHGRVWDDDAESFARHTVGWEVRLPVRLFGRVLAVPSYGEGQTLDWERDGAPFERDEYFRIAMVQPF